MNNKESITALMSSFGRAFHAENEKSPVFADNLAKKLMTEEEYQAVRGYILGGAKFFEPGADTEKQDPNELLRTLVNVHIAPSPLCRSAYAEQSLKTAVMTGTKQYVILGAGLDTFAFRNADFLAKYRVFEVDHPLTQQDKKARIARAGWAVPENLTFVPVDFTKDSLTERLIAGGFDKSVKSFFSWLGVSYYLYRDEIENTLKSLRQIMADGSTIVFDYADAGLFTSKVRRVQNMVAMAKAGGEEMKSSFDFMSAELMMSDLGFLVYEHLTPKDIQAQVIKNGSIKAFEHINYIQAVYKRK